MALRLLIVKIAHLCRAQQTVADIMKVYLKQKICLLSVTPGLVIFLVSKLEEWSRRRCNTSGMFSCNSTLKAYLKIAGQIIPPAFLKYPFPLFIKDFNHKLKKLGCYICFGNLTTSWFYLAVISVTALRQPFPRSVF